MSDQNAQTLETYENHFENYIVGTPGVTDLEMSQGKWLSEVVSGMPKNASILEIGSAFGRDAVFLKSLGYDNIQLTDAFDAAVSYLQNKGFSAKKFNVLQDEFTDKYDIILAAAVFLHFTEEDFRTATEKVRDALKPGGHFALSLKRGTGDKWTNEKMEAPRYFRYWQLDELEPVLESLNMKVIDSSTNDDGKWLYVIAGRSAE